MRKLFMRLLTAGTEDEVQAILDAEGLTSDASKWTPYGDNESFYGVVENQQAHPVPALVEKITNGIDAILEKKVLQDGLDIRSPAAPRSVSEALDRYFPDHRNWDLGDARRRQARDLQIVASGPRRDTSLLVYDDGVGQAPADFPGTFLSLLRGNKNDVHFVQGKYNMGGAGAIAFCGDRRFQLVASRRYDGSHPLGFTLLRRHPPTLAEAANRKNTWYEYLVFDGKVAAVSIDELDVGLEGRSFRTGSLLKLYSYRLPEGSRSIISRDLNLSLNEFLFEPALPFLTVDNNERYPDNRAPVTPVYGLKRRLEADTETVETRFSEVSRTSALGELGLTVYVFKARSRGQGVKESAAARLHLGGPAVRPFGALAAGLQPAAPQAPEGAPVRISTLFLRRLHKWIGLLLGAQLLLWTISGTAMALLDMETVAGGPQPEASGPAVPASSAWEQIRATLGSRPVSSVAVRPLLDRYVVEIAGPGEMLLFDAVDGRRIPVDAALARSIASAAYPGGGSVSKVSQLREITLEVREHALPIWRVDFDDAQNSSFYVSGASGRLLERRNDSWRLWDFAWMLHNMDYADRTSFNHPLIIAVGFGIVWLALTGLLLLFRTAWRPDLNALRRRWAPPRP